MFKVHILYESACIIGYCTYWVLGESFVCVMVLQMCSDFNEVVSCVHYPSSLSHGLITEGWLFLSLFNDAVSFNVRLTRVCERDGKSRCSSF